MQWIEKLEKLLESTLAKREAQPTPWDRSKEAAKELWNSLPPVYRPGAICYTDFWAAYENVIPKKRHRPVGKESGKTNHIERFNNTMRSSDFSFS